MRHEKEWYTCDRCESEIKMMPERRTFLTRKVITSAEFSMRFGNVTGYVADEYGGRLPVHVRVIADEFANIGQIPQFDKLIATIRSREISASIILQSQSQLKAMYKDSADTILGNCDTTLFLGGKEKTTLKEMSELLGNERMFLVTVLVMNTAKKRQKLDNNIFQVQGIAQKYNCSLKQLDYQQEAALMSCIPLGVNRIEIQRGLTTSATAIFVPFTTQELFQEGEALYYGLNALSNNMIMVDRKRLKNPNGLILGTPGSGKSFSAKREITNCFLITEDDIIICDPEAEYYPLVQALHGQVIRISPVSDQYINPMDLNLNYSEEDNPLSLKADFILSLCELIVGGKNGLEPVEKTIIDRCVRLVYQEYLADPVPEKMPILEDLYNLLRKQEEPEAQRLATSLEIYVTGSLNVFNHRTNVDINNRIVCFDIKELGKQLKKIGMLIVQDQVWNRVTINRSAHKSTRYYVDEFHLLLKEEQTAAYSVEIWKRFRKWGGIPTGITQNIKDLLAKVEELEEANYNMIDNVLNNMPPKKEPYLEYFATECDEFHDMGAYEKSTDVNQIAAVYEKYRENPKTAYLGCSMGIIYRDPEDSYYDEAEFAIVKGNTVFGDLMDDVRFYGELALVREGIEKIHEALPDYKYVPMRDVREAMYPEKMTTEQLAEALDEIAEAFDPYEYRDNVERGENTVQEVMLDLRSGNIHSYISYLKDIVDEECDLSVRAGVLIERLKAYEPELPKDMEPMVYVNYCEESDLMNPRCQKLSELDAKTAEMDKEWYAKRDPKTEEPTKIAKIYVTVYYAEKGEQMLHHFKKSMDIGNGHGGIVSQLKYDNEMKLTDEYWINYQKGKGSEEFQKYMEDLTDIQNHVLPYLQSFCNLEEKGVKERREQQIAERNEGRVDERGTSTEANAVVKDTGKADRKLVQQKQAVAGKDKKLSIHERLEINKKIIQEKQGKDKPERGADLGVRTV